jgi:ADP-ribose pyrophosphatase YjhB (NUDIX family)
MPVVAVLAATLGDQSRSIIMVKRGIPPFKGEWCLPCGYINRHEIPKVAAVREMQEETGLTVRLEKILCVCNPMPGEINQITISYLARIAEGSLKAGDDAEDVQIFRKENCPTPCFRSHNMLVEKWWDGRLGDVTGKDLD